MCIYSCPFITPGLRRTPKAKQRHRSSPSQEKVEEQKVDVPEENATESTGIVHSKEQAVEQPEEKDVPAQKNDKGQSESVHSRVLSFSFN